MPKTLHKLMDLKKLATNVNIDETEVKIGQDYVHPETRHSVALTIHICTLEVVGRHSGQYLVKIMFVQETHRIFILWVSQCCL